MSLAVVRNSKNWILQQSLTAYHENRDWTRIMNFQYLVDSHTLLCTAKFHTDRIKNIGVTTMSKMV